MGCMASQVGSQLGPGLDIPPLRCPVLPEGSFFQVARGVATETWDRGLGIVQDTSLGVSSASGLGEP